MEFKKHKLGEFIDTISETSTIKKQQVVLINTSDVENGKVLNHKYTENKNLKGQFKKRFRKDDILYSEIRPKNKRFAYVDFDASDYIASTKLMVLRNKGNIDNTFLYQLLKSNKIINQLQLLAESRSGTFPQITFNELANVEIEIPNIENQIKISKILTDIDSKIEINNQTNDNLLELIKKLYIEKIKNNNDINFEEKNLDEFCNIFTGKKNANASEENGQYKFFTCAPEPLSINSYIYDGPAVIVAGNGAYTGRTNFYNGKFDLYQRTYGITTNNDYIYLFYAMIYTDLQNDIMGGTHGSAIPYIVMNDIAKFKVKYNKELFDELSQKIKVLLLKIKSNEAQNETLEQLRDTLLPKLMNGEIDLDKMEI